MHATPSHYHDHANLLTYNEHIRWKIQEPCVNACWGYFVESTSKMSLVLLVIYFVFLVICIGLHVLIWPFKFRWSRGYICNSSYHHHLIGCVNLSRRCHNFSHGYVSEVAASSYAVGSIYIPGNLDCISLLMCSLMMCVNNRVYYGPMVVFVSLHITLPHYHYVDVSECIELLICLPCTFCRVCV